MTSKYCIIITKMHIGFHCINRKFFVTEKISREYKIKWKDKSMKYSNGRRGSTFYGMVLVINSEEGCI